MKRLAPDQIELIDAVIAEGAAGDISPGVLEKDVHVTDALAALMSLTHDHVHLAFCGGTNLSKAHHLIERMSEDVDLKVILDEGHGLTKTRLRVHLSELKDKVTEKLVDIGFEELADKRRALNDNRYFASHWAYASHYDHDASLRPYLSLELTVRTPRHGTVNKPIGYLVNKLAGRPEPRLHLDCVTIEETLSEKVISFLRRYSQNRAGEMRQSWDKALVRHVYDVYCIYLLAPSALPLAGFQFKALVDYDVGEFGKQYEAFAKNPKQVLLDALAQAETDAQLQDEYRQHLLPLVFGQARPSYQEAFQVFKRCAESLLPVL
jgi:predicted nucleotidyltransferase component of viral defense system